MPKRRVAASESDAGSSSSEFEPSKTSNKARKRTRRANSNLAKATTTIIPRVHHPPHGVSTHQIDSPGEVCRSLLDWYRGVSASRGMPWRKPYDPSFDKDARSQRAYEVWVSEIMLQQTQVATVIPYYNRWMAKFPTICDLAAASIDEVNSLWKGLGYYSRASRLLAGAQKVVKNFNGRLPDNAKDMEANIPGIGRYSAGAICSIAYGEAVPVLDGNVHRLLSRFLALHSLPKAKATLEILWSAAQAIVCGVKPPAEATHTTSTTDEDTAGARSPENPAIGYPGDVNQALIELGSTVCKVRDPKCEVCPLQNRCTAYLWSENNKTSSSELTDIEELCSVCEPLEFGGGVLAFPMKAERKKAREELDFVSVVEWRSKSHERHFLLVRRPESGLLAGLHEFPTSANVSAPISEATSSEMTNSLLSTYLAEVQPHPFSGSSDRSKYHVVDIKPAGEVLHVFSHIRKTYRVQWVLLEGRDRPPMILSSLPDAPPSSNGLNKRRKASPSKVNQRGDSALWLEMDQVPEANIGTGVRKVWELATKLWK